MSGTHYWMDPEDVKFDSKISQFNVQKEPHEYANLKREIKNDVQKIPILVRGGLCGDGVHRTKIAKELGRKVLVEDVDNAVSDKEFIKMCNRDTFTARNDSSTQKAIKAYKLTKEFGYSDIEAIRATGMKDNTKVVTYARAVAESQFNKKNNSIKDLLEGKATRIGSVRTKSIETAYREIKKLEQAEVDKDDQEEEKELVIDYNDYLESADGMTMFWIMKTAYKEVKSIDHWLTIIGLINKAYPQTGEEESGWTEETARLKDLSKDTILGAVYGMPAEQVRELHNNKEVGND